MTRPLDEWSAERLTEDDQAARAAEQWRTAALARHRNSAWGLMAAMPGRCGNCDTTLTSVAQRYCDADCQADHARRTNRGGR